MSLNKSEYQLKSKDRASIRNEVITLFLKEKLGKGTGEDSSKYHYTVEEYDEYKIILKRPTGLNKGFDFTVNVDGMFFKKNRRYCTPMHGDIKLALKYVKDNNPKNYEKVRKEVIKIFNAEDTNIENVKDIYFKDFENIERPIAIILLAMKWLFIEQDITYWNWSGRNMLMESIKSEGLI